MNNLKTKKEILEFINKHDLPLYPMSGVLVYRLPEKEETNDGIYLPQTYKQSDIRSGEVLKGIIVSDPINCEDEPEIKKGVTVMFKAASGYSTNVNGHQFHTLEVTDILAILDDE